MHRTISHLSARALIQINAEITKRQRYYAMSNERARDLVALCTEPVRKGEDFPTVWATVLKSHPLVDGLPESKLEGKRPMLEIRLFTGELLMFDSESKKFSMK